MYFTLFEKYHVFAYSEIVVAFTRLLIAVNFFPDCHTEYIDFLFEKLFRDL